MTRNTEERDAASLRLASMADVTGRVWDGDRRLADRPTWTLAGAGL